MHISPEKKCDFANHPRTRAHGCLNRLFPLLIVVSSTRGVHRGVGKRGGMGSYVYCGVWRVLLFVILGSRIITFFFLFSAHVKIYLFFNFFSLFLG